jgi:sugar (pentulose or hexulose) kinase
MSLSCQGETQLAIGDRDHALDNVIVWLDSRVVSEPEEVANTFGRREFN